MKKIFTLVTLLALTLGVQAQYRKSWNFTKWSATTIANFMADPNWTDDEKNDNYASKPATGENCRWEIKATPTEEGYVQANGEAIEELSGLSYISTSTNRGLAIATNYPDCTERDGADFGPYYGAAYLWLCTKNLNYFVIPHVELGTTIKMGVESHKFSSSRGVTLYVGHDQNGTKVDDPVDAEGNAVSGGNVTNYRDLTWQIPNDIEATNDDGTVDICVRTNSGGGMHIYYITVGDGDSPQVQDAKPVAYLYSGSLDEDYAYVYLAGASEKFALTEINVDETDATAESLISSYDAVVISPTIAADNAYVPTIKQLIAYVPVLNMNPNLYDVWGYGKAIDGGSTLLGLLDVEFAGFEGLAFDPDAPAIDLLTDGSITAVELGEYFANDVVLATAGNPDDNIVAMHMHNQNRNAYALLPLTMTNMPAANHDVISVLVPNMVQVVANTKRDVTAVSTPNISIKQEDGFTTVTITAANSKAIYYTTDGSDPTTESTLYTEPFDVTAACTVKAFATGDGYTDSQVAEKAVTVAVKAAAPTFSIVREEGKSVVTLSCATAGVDLYYNFAGQNATTASVKYTEPFEVTTPATVTAFADAAEGFLASDMVQEFVGVNGFNNQTIRWDVMAHFDANADDWQGKGLQTNDAGEIVNPNYFFTWGKNAGEYWDTTSEQVQKTDEDGDLVYDDEGNPVMVYSRTVEGESFDPGNGWIIKSIGQIMTWEKLNIGWNIGDTSMRNPDTAEDAIGVNDEQGITENTITFGKQPTDGPFNASLETTQKYAGPFDVIVYAGNGNEGEIPTMQIETSADGQQWTKLGDVAYSLTKRNWKKTQLSYEGTDEVFVRLLHTAAKSGGQIYDIYLMNNGVKSQQYAEQGSGIVSAQPEGAVVRTELFSLDGKRIANSRRGIVLMRRTYQNGTVRTEKVLR